MQPENRNQLKEFKACLFNVKEAADYLNHLVEEEELPRSWEELQENQTINEEFLILAELIRKLMNIYRAV